MSRPITFEERLREIEARVGAIDGKPYDLHDVNGVVCGLACQTSELAALESRVKALEAVRDPEKGRDVIEAAMAWYRTPLSPENRDPIDLALCRACEAYTRAQRGE